MILKLLRIRYVYLVAVLFTLLNSIVFVLVGIMHSIKGYQEFLRYTFHPDETLHPGLYLLEGLDAFMISLVFMIFGLGIAVIFVFDKTQIDKLPEWLKIKSLGELKTMMWETILFTLMIFAVTRFFKFPLDIWEALIFPIIILILSIAFFFMNRIGNHKH